MSTIITVRFTKEELGDLDAAVRFFGYGQLHGGRSKAIKEALALVRVNHQRTIDDFENRYAAFDVEVIKKYLEVDHKVQ